MTPPDEREKEKADALTGEIEKRFWGHVQIYDQGNFCWPWLSIRDRCGYGQFKINRKNLVASRIAWELHNGPIPKGLCVLHRCDNPPCCNPSHLFLGTRGDNIRDCVAKGRHPLKTATKCKHGHLFSSANTRIRANGERDCIACGKARSLAYFRKHRTMLNARRSQYPKKKA